MEIIKKYISTIIFIFSLALFCASPRDVCYTSAEHASDYCKRLLRIQLLAGQNAADPEGLAFVVAAACIEAEAQRRNCEKKSNIPFINF